MAHGVQLGFSGDYDSTVLLLHRNELSSSAQQRSDRKYLSIGVLLIDVLWTQNWEAVQIWKRPRRSVSRREVSSRFRRFGSSANQAALAAGTSATSSLLYPFRVSTSIVASGVKTCFLVSHCSQAQRFFCFRARCFLLRSALRPVPSKGPSPILRMPRSPTPESCSPTPKQIRRHRSNRNLMAALFFRLCLPVTIVSRWRPRDFRGRSSKT